MSNQIQIINSSGLPNDLFDKILNYSRLNKSETTKRNYHYYIIDFARFAAKEQNLQLPEDDTSQYMNIAFNPLIKQGKLHFYNVVINYIEHLNDQKQAPRTISAKIAAIKNYVNTLKAMNFIDWDISLLKGPKIEKSEVEGPSEEMFKKLLSYVNGLWEMSSYISKRNALMFYVLVFCGLRESEVISIKIENINFDKKTLKSPKKGYRQLKETRIPDNTLEKIKLFLKEDGRESGYLFIGKSEINPTKDKINRSTLWRIIKSICEKCGYDDLHPHSFRHFFVTEALVASGHNTRVAMKATGHKSEKVFNDYEDKRKDDQGILMNKIEDRWMK